MSPDRGLVHHELCFGCGRQNLFGLQVELERTTDESVTGRCFIKQDHQGPERGFAHPGIVALALIEAMTFLRPEPARLTTLDLVLTDDVPVGGFLKIEARADQDQATARTLDYGCSARGNFQPWPRST